MSLAPRGNKEKIHQKEIVKRLLVMGQTEYDSNGLLRSGYIYPE
jgi:hypothetical protein